MKFNIVLSICTHSATAVISVGVQCNPSFDHDKSLMSESREEALKVLHGTEHIDGEAELNSHSNG
jgi:hypothetical protein